MTIREMIERQQQIVNAARTAGRDMTSEETAEFERLQRSIDAARAAATHGAGSSGQGSSATPAAGSRQQNTGDDPDGDPDPEGDTQRAVAAERARIQSITEMCTQFGMESRDYIQNGTTVDQMRAAVIEHLTNGGAPVNTGVRVLRSEEDKYRAAVSDALLQRGGITVEKPAEGSRDFMGMSIRNLAVECLIKEGGSTDLYRKSAEEIYQMAVRGFYNPESAFPAILDQTIEKAYKEGYNKVNVTFDKFCKKGTLTDFKKHEDRKSVG